MAVCQNGSVNELDSKDIAKKPMSFTPPLNWIGYENNYFLQAVVPVEGGGYQIESKMLNDATGLLQVGYLTEPFQIQSGQQKSFKLRLYMGPKELSQLNAAGYDLARAADYGWFDFLARPLLYVLKWFYKYTHNYGVAIILLTVVIKILFWPLTHKSYKSMQAMLWVGFQGGGRPHEVWMGGGFAYLSRIFMGRNPEEIQKDVPSGEKNLNS